MRTLQADPSHDLDWEILPEETSYYLDFGAKLDLPLLNAHLFAVEEFVKKAPHARKVVLGKLKLEGSEGLDSIQLLSDYFHRLASPLSDTMEGIIEVNISKTFPLAESVLYFCSRRFEHLTLHFTEAKPPLSNEASIGVSLPVDPLYDPAVYAPLFESLGKRSFKCIPEEHLNEQWEGVDHLIIDPNTMGEIGKRMLYGFEAAGGEIISMGDPIGFDNEAPLEKFLSE